MSRSIVPADATYPPELFELRHPPPLFIRGELPPLPGVAIVGAREASEEALLFTEALVAALAAAGFAIWSGGARGVDGRAHRAALEQGAPTVAVLAGGLDHLYPSEHEDLFNRIVERDGALVARVPPEVRPSPARFLLRNEVLAALTIATVVVEAGIKSGALRTAAIARRLGRTLCVVPNAPWIESVAGAAHELVRGARPVASPEDVLAALGRPMPKSSVAKRSGPSNQGVLPLLDVDVSTHRSGESKARTEPQPALEGAELAVFSALSAQPIHVDVVCERAELPMPRVAEALLTLTLKAVVVEEPAGSFRRASSFV